MLSLQQHIEIESARWAASRGDIAYEESIITSSTSSSTSSIFSRSSPSSKGADTNWKKLYSKYKTHRLSRRSSTSSFATEIEPQAEGQQGQGQQFVVPRDFNGEPITVYASLEAAVAQSVSRLAPLSSSGEGGRSEGFGGTGGGGGDVGQGFGQGHGQGQGLVRREEEQPRRLVTPGKLYENEEEDDEIIYE